MHEKIMVPEISKEERKWGVGWGVGQGEGPEGAMEAEMEEN